MGFSKGLIVVTFAVLSWASTATGEGVFINCGGDTISEMNQTWKSDSLITPGGSTYVWRGLVDVDANKNITADEDSIFHSMRYFGSQSQGVNTYSIPVNTTGYHIVRLYFAEILYQSPKLRSFSVWIQNFLALDEFSLPSANTLVVKEYYIPIYSGAVNVTFVRGKLGDPMISAIEVVLANRLYGWLEPVAGNSTVWMREYALDCGIVGVYWPDKAGRMWIGDLPYATAFSAPYYSLPDTKKNTSKGWVYDEQRVLEGSDMAPEYLPEVVYRTARAIGWTKALNNPIEYSFPAMPNTYYRVRFHLSEYYVDLPGFHIQSFLINGIVVLQDYDCSQAYAAAVVFDYSLLSTNTTLQIQILAKNTGYNTANTMLNGLEIFRALPPMNLTEALAYAALAPPPGPPSPLFLAEVAKAQSTEAAWKAAGAGVAVGVAITLVLFGLIVLLVMCIKRRGFFGRRTTDMEGKSAGAFLLKGGDYSDNQKKTKGLPGGGCFKPTRGHNPSIGSDDGIWAKFSGPSGARPFTFEELEQATNGFSAKNVVGRGGFGLVYRAKLACGIEVAVKRLALESEQGEREFTTEVELLTRLHHRNLVNLIGYCEERSHLMLVYEFVSNGTLREHLLDGAKADGLAWPARLRILLGAARGIEYLHQGATPAVIHRDIKTSNILLESTLEAKVADFGLSKLGKAAMDAEATHISTAVKGTMGYLDPQYYKTRRLTEKSDVYSFGVVMLEVITGRLPMWIDEVSSKEMSTASTFTDSVSDEHSECLERVNMLVEWAIPSIKSGQVLQIGAPQLQDFPATHLPSLQAVAEIAARCVGTQPKDRPNMSEVVRGLESASGLVTSTNSLAAKEKPAPKPPAAKGGPAPKPPATVPKPAEAPRQLFKAGMSKLGFGSFANV